MPANEPRDSRVIRHQIASDHPVGHILAAVPLNPREDRTPVATEYKTSVTITDGS